MRVPVSEHGPARSSGRSWADRAKGGPPQQRTAVVELRDHDVHDHEATRGVLTLPSTSGGASCSSQI